MEVHPVSGQPHDGLSSRVSGRSLLYVDMAYSLDELTQRKHLQFFEARHSGKYFNKVVGLHPLANRVTKLAMPYMRRPFSARQDVIEASASALNLPRILAPLNFLISQWRLFKRIKHVVINERLEFVAATDPIYSGLFASWIARATGRPLIIHLVAHYENLYRSTGSVGMPKLFPFYWLEKQIIRHVFGQADLVAAGSVKLGEYAERMGARTERIKHFRVTKNIGPQHHSPPNQRPSPDSFLADLGLPNASRLLLTIARFHPVKLVDHAIRAMGIIVLAHPKSVLLLAGDGPERVRLENLVEQLGLNNNVRFLGLIDQNVLAKLIPHTVALAPLTGMALYETSLGGAPAVAYDIDAQISELVEDGVTGYLIPFADVDGLAAGIIRILDRPQDAAKMGRAIRKRALEIANPEANEAIEHEAFDAIIADRTVSHGSGKTLQ